MTCCNDHRFVVFSWKQSQMQKQLQDPSTGNELGSGAQAGVGRNLADKKINWQVLILKMLTDLSVCYFNPLALYTVKPPGANICLVDSNVTIHCILNISLFYQKKSIDQMKPI